MFAGCRCFLALKFITKALRMLDFLCSIKESHGFLPYSCALSHGLVEHLICTVHKGFLNGVHEKSFLQIIVK